jgi:hypothetical protein
MGKGNKMEISPEKTSLEPRQSGSFSKVLFSALGVVLSLIGFETLSKKDQLDAGIDLNNNDQED